MQPRLRARLDAYDAIVSQMDDIVALESLRQVGAYGHLIHGSMTSGALAEVTGTSEARLRVFLDLVVHLGFLRRDGDAYALIPGDEELFDPQGPYAATQGTGDLAHYTRRRGSAVQVLRSDEPLASVATGGEVDEAARDAFYAHVHVRSRDVAQEVAALVDPSGVKRIADLGCGPGTYALELLKRCPDAHATLVDRPNARGFIERLAEEWGLADRVTFLGVDMVDGEYGADFDVVLLSEVIHNFGDRRNQSMIRQVSSRLRPGGRVLIKDCDIAADRSGPKRALRFALALAIFAPEGGIYPATDVMRWLTEAGLSHEITYGLRALPDNYLVVGRKT